MSKVLLASGLDLLREAERSEMEADRLYDTIIKSGDKIKNFAPVREGLRTSYQKWIRGLETMNFVRRAAIEAERLNKLKKQLAKLEVKDGTSGGGDENTNEEENGSGGGLVTDLAKEKLQHNQKRGLAACSDEIIRNGVPHEIISLCDGKMKSGFEHCETIRQKESSLLLAIRDADSKRDDCSKSRPGYAVAQVLAFRDPSPTAENEGLLQGNYTVTVPVVDGSYQVLIKNHTDVFLAAPDVTCQVVATWRPEGTNVPEKKQYSGPCPPGTAFLRSFGIVGNDGSIFVHVNSNGMRHSRIEVVVRRLVPASVANIGKSASASSSSPTKSGNTSSNNGATGVGDDNGIVAPPLIPPMNNNSNNNNAAGGGSELANLLPPIVPLGGVVAPPPSASLQNEQQPGIPQQQQQLQPTIPLTPQQQYQQQQPIPAAPTPAAVASENSTSQNQNQQQQTLQTAQQVKDRIMKLINMIEYEFPKEVIVPMNVDLDDDDDDETTTTKTSQAEKEQKLLQEESNKRTQQEKEYEVFLMELPPPTDLFGDDDDLNDGDNAATNQNPTSQQVDQMIMDLVQNLGPNLDDLKEMEEQMMGLDDGGDDE